MMQQTQATNAELARLQEIEEAERRLAAEKQRILEAAKYRHNAVPEGGV